MPHGKIMANPKTPQPLGLTSNPSNKLNFYCNFYYAAVQRFSLHISTSFVRVWYLRCAFNRHTNNQRAQKCAIKIYNNQKGLKYYLLNLNRFKIRTVTLHLHSNPTCKNQNTIIKPYFTRNQLKIKKEDKRRGGEKDYLCQIFNLR
jgi:hypothetical protein